MVTELQDATVQLIAELPNEVGNMRLPQVKALADLSRRVALLIMESAQADRRLLDLVESRDPAPGVPIGEYLTEDEIAAHEANAQRFLDAERADAALDEWKERSGLRARVEALAGEKLPPRPEMLTMEDPDGGVLYRC